MKGVFVSPSILIIQIVFKFSISEWFFIGFFRINVSLEFNCCHQDMRLCDVRMFVKMTRFEFVTTRLEIRQCYY